jgi:hypothetical protein
MCSVANEPVPSRKQPNRFHAIACTRFADDRGISEKPDVTATAASLGFEEPAQPEGQDEDKEMNGLHAADHMPLVAPTHLAIFDHDRFPSVMSG